MHALVPIEQAEAEGGLGPFVMVRYCTMSRSAELLGEVCELGHEERMVIVAALHLAAERLEEGHEFSLAHIDPVVH